MGLPEGSRYFKIRKRYDSDFKAVYLIYTSRSRLRRFLNLWEYFPRRFRSLKRAEDYIEGFKNRS